jgi:hypothetical protein
MLFFGAMKLSATFVSLLNLAALSALKALRASGNRSVGVLSSPCMMPLSAGLAAICRYVCCCV